MPETPPTLFLVDGYGLIYRAFYAMISRPLTTGRGENTSAAWGVVNFLMRLFEKYHPTHLAWVHDAGNSFRKEAFPAYKATREKLSTELQQDFDRSLERIESLLKAYRVPLIALEGYEADDVIGTLATQAAGSGFPVAVVSGDKDFYQLISPAISILNPGRGGAAGVEEQWVDLRNATERLGVPPERVVDYLALVGDSSDNVPGVRGVGEKTAVQLIQQFGELDTILARAAEVTGKRAREALLSSGDDARVSRELVTIRRNVPITLELDALKVGAPDLPELRRLFAELEFHTLIEKLEPAIEAAPTREQPVGYTVVDSPDAVRGVVDEIRRAGTVALKVEGSHSDPLQAELVGVGLAIDRNRTWYFPFAHRLPDGELVAETHPVNLPPLRDPRLAPLAALLSDPSVPKEGHDIRYDWLVLRVAGVELHGVMGDTMLSSFVLDPGRRSHGIESLVIDHLGGELPPRGGAAPEKDRSPAELPVSVVAAHVCAVVGAVNALQRQAAPDIARHSVEKLLNEVEMPLVQVLVDMQWRGIAIDVAGLATLSRRFGEELREIEQGIHREAGVEFNIGSTLQLRHILFEKLMLPVIKKTKTGPSTDADVLAELGAMGFAVPRLLIEYRELTKLRSTYTDVLGASVNPRTGRIHTTFNQTGAATGRLSSSDPNLQNIPVRTPRGELIRRCFVPRAGARFIVADYSQIELRLLAHLSEDPAFIGAFERGGDIHRETAAIIFDVEVSAVTPDMRARAKTINFATIYGQGPFALSRQLGISMDEARDFIKRYFERFAGVRRFLDQSIERARTLGYAETLLGRRRYIPELRERNFNIRAFGERTAMNSPLQGSAADLIKLAMINLAAALNAAGSKAAMLLQVHDELVLEAPDADVDAAVPIVRREMEQAASLKVPLLVDIGVGDNWLDAKR